MRFQGFTGGASFQFVANINVRFGSGIAQTLPVELTALGVSKPFVMIDPGVFSGGVAAPVVKGLEAGGIAARVFTDVAENPSDATIERAFGVARKSGC